MGCDTDLGGPFFVALRDYASIGSVWDSTSLNFQASTAEAGVVAHWSKNGSTFNVTRIPWRSS
jgi:hypothetical protein